MKKLISVILCLSMLITIVPVYGEDINDSLVSCLECGLSDGHLDNCSQFVSECTCGQEVHIEGCNLFVESDELERSEEQDSPDNIVNIPNNETNLGDDLVPDNSEISECICDLEIHSNDCPLYEALVDYDLLMSFELLVDWVVLFDNIDLIMGLSNDEKLNLIDRVEFLYFQIETPTEEDTELKIRLVNLLNSYIIVVCSECGLEDNEHLETCSNFENIEIENVVNQEETEETEETEDIENENTDENLNSKEDQEDLEDQEETPSDPVYSISPDTEIIVSDFERIIDLDNLDDIYQVLLEITFEKGVNFLTEDEVQTLYDKVVEMNEIEEYEYFEDLVDTLQYIAGDYELNNAQVLADWAGQTSGTYNFTGTYIVNSEIVIPANSTLKITGNGVIERSSSYTGNLFNVSKGATLIIGDSTNISSNKELIVIDGNNIVSASSVIYSSGRVELYNTTIQNNKNRANSSYGGGIRILAGGSLFMDTCKVTNNTATNSGGGIYSVGPMTIKNSEISYNKAMATETYNGGSGSKVNLGRGGGFRISGADCILENTDIIYNIAMYYGGGGQVDNSGSVELKSGSISYNEAVLQGAGGLHVTANATFTLINGELSNNIANSVGGAIHSSYSCVLNLNGGIIKNNIVYGRGGGVHINVGGDLILNGTILSNNSAYIGTNKYAATVDNLGDTYSNVKEMALSTPTGYGGGVLIDSGTATMNSGEISNNWAESGGGGIAFVMISMGNGTNFEKNKVVSFKMNNGFIYDNETDGNGGGIYLMKNMLSSDMVGTSGNYIDGIPKIELLSGKIYNNSALGDGGAAYQEENTEFVMSGNTDIYKNSAYNGGAVCIQGGDVTIHNGLLRDNNAENNGGAIYIDSDSVDVNINIYDGEIIDNESGNHAGAIGVNAGSGCTVNLNIGEELCKGNNITKHADNTCPIISDNIATKFGGAFCLHGDADKLFVNLYCGEIINNSAIRNYGSNSLKQNGGTVTVYGGDIDPGIMVGGGSYTDTRIDAEQVYFNLWSNYPGGPSEPTIIDVTRGVTFVFPSDTYEWEGHVLSGWASQPDNKGLYVPVQGEYVVDEETTEYVDFYAVWDAQTSYVVYIPAELTIDPETYEGEFELQADINYFKKDSVLNVYLESDFLLRGVNTSVVLPYSITLNESGILTNIESGDVIASYKYNYRDSKFFIIELLGFVKEMDRYVGSVTFTIEYDEVEEEYINYRL